MWRFYLIILFFLVVALVLVPTFLILDRFFDAFLSAFFSGVAAVLLRRIHLLTLEEMGAYLIWAAYVGVLSGVLVSPLGVYNPVLGLYHLLLLLCAIFLPRSLFPLGGAILALYTFFMIYPFLGIEYYSPAPAIADVILGALWFTLSVVFMRFIVQSLVTRSQKIEKQQHELIRYQDDLEELVYQRTIELEESRKDADEARVAAESASRSKSHFLANMSHELRTPLNAIIGYSELISEVLTDVKEPRSGISEAVSNELGDALQDVQAINQSGSHLLAVINQVLDLSRIEADTVEPNLTAVSVKKILAKSVDVILPLAQKKQLDFVCQDTLPADLEIISDPIQMSQILVNLLANAVKFTEQGSITLTTKPVTIESRPFISFEIADTGIGMSADMVKNVFQPFWQAEMSYVRHYSGTGLGLTISNRLCEGLNGQISLTSEEGVGTTFTVLLPEDSRNP